MHELLSLGSDCKDSMDATHACELHLHVCQLCFHFDLDLVTCFVASSWQELRSLGADFKDSAGAARAFELHKCGHGEEAGGAGAVPAAQCLAQMIGEQMRGSAVCWKGGTDISDAVQ